MKDYTPEERREAKARLPKPIRDFIDSDALLQIYFGVIQKNHINWRQAGTLTEITNATLLGLESESALETNFHQALPELSADTMRELVADVNDRVFKEARRRLAENIVEPEPKWDEEELGPKPKEEESEKLASDEELDKLAEKEEKEGWKPPEEEYVPLPSAEDGNILPSVQTPAKSIAEQKLAIPIETTQRNISAQTIKSGIQQIAVPSSNPPAVIIPVSPISAPKQILTLPKTETPAPVTVLTPPKSSPAPVPAVPEIKPETPPVPVAISENKTEPKPVPAPQTPGRYTGGVDPYREPIE